MGILIQNGLGLLTTMDDVVINHRADMKMTAHQFIGSVFWVSIMSMYNNLYEANATTAAILFPW